VGAAGRAVANRMWVLRRSSTAGTQMRRSVLPGPALAGAFCVALCAVLTQSGITAAGSADVCVNQRSKPSPHHPAMQVFDERTRLDPSPSRPLESLSQFLNRIHTPYWAAVRDLIENWFTRLPGKAQKDVRGRLRSKDNRQFHGAFWELYLHESLIQSGFEVECHPEVVGTRRVPDFLARRGGAAMYVEARTTFEQSVDPGDDKRLGQFLNALNRLEDPNFHLWVEVATQGPGDVKVGPLRSQLEKWLGELDPDETIQQLEASGEIDAVGAVAWEVEGWKLIVHPVPKSPGRRGLTGTPAVGIHGPAEASMIDNVGPLRAALSDKGSAYGTLEYPFVIAIRSSNDFADDFDIEGALFGSSQVQFRRYENGQTTATEVRAPDGYWYAGDHWAHRNVSGVLIARSLMPWTVATDSPELWHHPDPERCVTEVPPLWRQAIPDETGLRRQDAQVTARDGFAPSRWLAGRRPVRSLPVASVPDRLDARCWPQSLDVQVENLRICQRTRS
jgi:hypothetical protein